MVWPGLAWPECFEHGQMQNARKTFQIFCYALKSLKYLNAIHRIFFFTVALCKYKIKKFIRLSLAKGLANLLIFQVNHLSEFLFDFAPLFLGLYLLKNVQ